MSTPRTVKVAVVGSGLAGLTAAHLLTRPCEGEELKFEVHLFEKAPEIGMDSSSISIANPGHHGDWRIDVPMRSFQGGYYKNLIALYQNLGVQFRQADFSYSFSSLIFGGAEKYNRSIRTTMIYNGGSGRSGVSKPSTLRLEKRASNSLSSLVQDFQTWFLFLSMTLKLGLCYAITLFYSLPFWRSPTIPTMSFQDWVLDTTPKNPFLKWIGFDTMWKDYIETTLIPLFSAVCTAPAEDILNHPVEEFLDYVWLTFGTHHYVVNGGVRDVVARLATGIQHLHIASPIISIKDDEQDTQCAIITCLSDGIEKEYRGFHHIILATQAVGAVPILTKYLSSLPTESSHQRTSLERQIECLKAFDYRKSIVINHTDGTLLPDDARDVRDLNLISSPFHPFDPCFKSDPYNVTTSDLCVSPTYTMATHMLTTPKGYLQNQTRVFQTTNPIIPPRKDSLLSVSKLERAIVTMKSKAALNSLCLKESKKWWQCPYESKTRLGELQGQSLTSEKYVPGIWICGSYAYLGIPLLEGCVVSARNVAEGILKQENVRWKQEPWQM